ncbi:MAG: alpha-N-arabinofuranosidase, partial [Bacteroidota bacterium]
MKKTNQFRLLSPVLFIFFFSACNNEGKKAGPEEKTKSAIQEEKKKQPVSQPLISDIYTADPSAHIFNGRIYIYPSHDTATGTPE